MRTTVLTVVLLVGLLSSGIAQVDPMDPLRRLEEEGGHYAWQVGIAYSPQGQEATRVDETGIPCPYVRLHEERQLSLAVQWNPGETLKVGVDLVQVSSSLKERLLYPTEERESIRTSAEILLSSFVEQRIAPTSQLDPRIRVTFDLPGSTSVSASASWIIDPTVLTASAGLQYAHERPREWFFVDLGAGLVANSRVSLIASGSLNVPLDTAGIPLASVGFRVRYTYDMNQKEISLGLNLLLWGYLPRIRVSLSFHEQGP